MVNAGGVITTTYYIGNYYEVSATSGITTTTKYYYFGGTRVAMRTSAGVTHLHADHLGSTSVASSASGALVARQTYFPYGAPRTSDGTLPTDYTFTGQRADASAGLMYYGARYYDAQLGRFISADTIVPSAANPQALNRYAYVYNNPLKYVDPTGHFGKDAIEKYLKEKYGDEWEKILKEWQDDKDWWDMISAAEGGDVLCGGTQARDGTSFNLRFVFRGKGQDLLEGIDAYDNETSALLGDTSLVDIQRGFKSIIRSIGIYDHTVQLPLDWVGFVRLSDVGKPSFYFRDKYTKFDYETPESTRKLARIGLSFGFGIVSPASVAKGVIAQLSARVGAATLGVNLSDFVFDVTGTQVGDAHVHIGPAYFHFRLDPTPSRSNWSWRGYDYQPGR